MEYGNMIVIMYCQSILLNYVDIKCCKVQHYNKHYTTINTVMVKKNLQCNTMVQNEKWATACPLKDTEIGPHSLLLIYNSKSILCQDTVSDI